MLNLFKKDHIQYSNHNIHGHHGIFVGYDSHIVKRQLSSMERVEEALAWVNLANDGCLESSSAWPIWGYGIIDIKQ